MLGTGYWIYSVVDVATRLQVYIQDPQSQEYPQPPTFNAITEWYDLFNALVTVNVCSIPSQLSIRLMKILVRSE